MTEIKPDITYASSDDLLRLRLPDNFGDSEYQQSLVEDLGPREGMEFTDEQLLVNIGEAFAAELRQNPNQPTTHLQAFLAKLNFLMPLTELVPTTDPVLSLNDIGYQKLEIGVHPQFQRWLNSQPVIPESVKQTVLPALKRPFIGQLSQNYEPSIQLRPGKFAVSEQVTVEGTDLTVSRSGVADWPRLRLQVTGHKPVALSAPAYQPEPFDANQARLGGELYVMKTQGLESSRQALGLLLAAGSLAVLAANYEGTEDIFAGAQWNVVSNPGWSFTKER